MVRALVALVLFAAVGCGAVPGTTGASPSPQSTMNTATKNVTGILVRGPDPTCPPDEPCDPHPQGAKLIFSRAGSPDVWTPVDDNGAFALHLDPGGYSIRAAPPPLKGHVQPGDVRVPASGSVLLHLEIVSTG